MPWSDPPSITPGPWILSHPLSVQMKSTSHHGGVIPNGGCPESAMRNSCGAN